MTRLLREHRTLVAVHEAAQRAGLPAPIGDSCSILERYDDHTIVSLQVADLADVRAWGHYLDAPLEDRRDPSVKCDDWMDVELRVWCLAPVAPVLSGRLL